MGASDVDREGRLVLNEAGYPVAARVACERPRLLSSRRVKRDGVVHRDPCAMVVPCSRCAACVETKRGRWANRFRAETAAWLRGGLAPLFVTLTLDAENLARWSRGLGDGEWSAKGFERQAYREMRLFLERLRRSGVYCRYAWTVECGTLRKRPHVHAILWGVPLSVGRNVILGAWGQGRVDVQLCRSDGSYVAKYIGGDGAKLFVSRRPGIGAVAADEVARSPWVHKWVGEWGFIPWAVPCPVPGDVNNRRSLSTWERYRAAKVYRLRVGASVAERVWSCEREAAIRAVGDRAVEAAVDLVGVARLKQRATGLVARWSAPRDEAAAAVRRGVA